MIVVVFVDSSAPVMVELFSGSGVMSETFKKAGYRTYTVELKECFKPDLVADINFVEAWHIIEELGDVDVLWSGQLCRSFSMLSVHYHFDKFGNPKSEQCKIDIKTHKHTNRIIRELCPRLWFVENPLAMLQKQPWMREFVFYNKGYMYPFDQCQYGYEYRKPSMLFTNAKGLNMKRCYNGAPCHKPTPRGSKSQSEHKGVYPQGLCDFILNVALNQN